MAALLATAPTLCGQPPDSLAIIQANALHSPAYDWLQELTDTIGPRLTASPQAVQAEQWAAARMKQIGLANVHLESWTIHSGWQRGPARAELIAPFQVPLNIASYGWTGSTAAPSIEADLALVNRDRLAEEIRKNARSWSGKILFLASLGPKLANSSTNFSELARLTAAAESARAAAIIAHDPRPGVMLTHTGPVDFTADASYSLPVLDLATEQHAQIARLLSAGKPVRIRLSVENKFSNAPLQAVDVIGDIPGRENPEQVVILGAHLDSWDLGTGAIDDGYGVAAILAAADAIVKSGAKPRRTIRVILFTGEEEGLLGSRAYVRAHESEMENVVCALDLDWGSGPITGLPLAGHDELEADLQPLAARIDAIQPLKISKGYLFFTDAYSFTLAGVPGLAFLQDSRDYTLIGHSAADTLDKVDAQILLRNTAVAALAAFWIADHPKRFGRRWPADVKPPYVW